MIATDWHKTKWHKKSQLRKCKILKVVIRFVVSQFTHKDVYSVIHFWRDAALKMLECSLSMEALTWWFTVYEDRRSLLNAMFYGYEMHSWLSVSFFFPFMIKSFFLCSQHAVPSVLAAPVGCQDLRAPPMPLWCTQSWSWALLPQTTAPSRIYPSLSWLTWLCHETVGASCRRYNIIKTKVANPKDYMSYSFSFSEVKLYKLQHVFKLQLFSLLGRI